jgi:hypothetical protein
MCQPLATSQATHYRSTALFGTWSLRRTERASGFSPQPCRNQKASSSFLPEYGTDTVLYRNKKKPNLGLTEPEETERSYQDHFLLILCENLATPAMMGYDTRMKDGKGISVTFPSSTPRGGKEATPRQGPEEHHDSRLTTP